MSNKSFMVLLAILIIGAGGVITFNKRSGPPPSERPGIEKPDKGQKHVEEGSVKYGGPEPPTSGDHGSPLQWQAYDQEVPDMNVIHNMEHGGVYISYRPDLPPEQIAKLKALFFRPYSKADFQPTKAIVAPRAANSAPIILTSWRRSLKMEKYDEAMMIEYYLRNVGKSPEGTSG